VKFVLAIVVYLIMGLVLALGILHTLQGRPSLLIAGLVAYVLAFAKLGCLPGKAH
jgi:hypothetical protein